MPGKRASRDKQDSTSECAAGRLEGRKALWAGGGRHRPRRGETTGRDTLGTGEQEAARESIWKLPPQ